MTKTQMLIIAICYIVFAPVIGALLAGVDRKLTARLQGRVGPPILQPIYDVFKLLGKQTTVVNHSQTFFVWIFVAFMIFTGVLFFIGGDLLLVFFALTLASIFFVVAAYATNSPYSTIGAERELMQMVAYEPMVLLSVVGLSMAVFNKHDFSFMVSDIIQRKLPAVVYVPGVFLGFTYILTIKLRKSPFDLSTSHHGHQELVKGITTEFAGRTLALVEIAHWYENVLLLGFIALFFAFKSPISPFLGIGVALLVYLLEILIDNTFARVKWQRMLGSAWLVTATVGFLNLIVLSLWR